MDERRYYDESTGEPADAAWRAAPSATLAARDRLAHELARLQRERDEAREQVATLERERDILTGNGYEVPTAAQSNRQRRLYVKHLEAKVRDRDEARAELAKAQEAMTHAFDERDRADSRTREAWAQVRDRDELLAVVFLGHLYYTDPRVLDVFDSVLQDAHIPNTDDKPRIALERLSILRDALRDAGLLGEVTK